MNDFLTDGLSGEWTAGRKTEKAEFIISESKETSFSETVTVWTDSMFTKNDIFIIAVNDTEVKV